jgi:hypothetical protein
MSFVTGEGISGTGRLSESRERLMNSMHGRRGSSIPPRASSSGLGRDNEYWAAAATEGGSGGGRGHERTGSNGHVLFSAYDGAEDDSVESGSGIGLAHMGSGGSRGKSTSALLRGDEDEDSEDGMDSLPSYNSHGATVGSGSNGRRILPGSVGGAQHKRSASLKSVVGTNGKVISGGATTNGGGALGAVKTGGGSR